MSCVYIKRYILISIASLSVFLPLIQPEWFTDIQVNIYNYSSAGNSVRIQWSTAITGLQAIFYKANDSLGLALKKQKILLFHGIPLGLPRQCIHSPSFLLSLSYSLLFPLPTSLSPSLLLSFRPPPSLSAVPVHIQIHSWKTSLLRVACCLPHRETLFPPSFVLCFGRHCKTLKA